MSSGSSGVENASESAARSSRFRSSATCSQLAHPLGRGLVARRPRRERVEAVHGGGGLGLKRAEDVGIPGQEPAAGAHASPSQTSAKTAPRSAAAGSVASHPNAMVRTTVQRTWRQRRRPTPTPITDDATTCVVETGAPTYDDARITAVEVAWLENPSIGCRWKMRRPTVRTIVQPPIAVPA